MALEVNNQNLFQNAQFQQFVDFAEAAAKAGKQKAIARLDPGELGGIANRTIKPGSGDWVGIGAGRLASLKKANNITRDAFMKAVGGMFGGESRIPDSVRDAMKLEDYGKGRPLTARRIIAVKAAIEQAVEKTKTAAADAKAGFPCPKGESSEKAGKLIDKAFSLCNGNSDAIDIVKAHIFPLTVNAESSLRSEESVQKKVEGLIDNLNELKEVSKNSPGIYAAGKKMLEETGVSLPKGMIAKLVQAANDAPLTEIRKLSGNSSGMDIHRAVMQLHNSLKKAMVSSGAGNLDGADEKVGARDFVATAILSRCGKGALANIRSALDSQNASALNEYYSLTDDRRNGFVENPSDDLREGIKEAGTLGFYALEAFDHAVNDNLRRLNPGTYEESRVKPFDGEFDIDDIGGDELIDATVSIAKDISAERVQNISDERVQSISDERVQSFVDERVQSFVDQTVEGSGKGADAMKKIITDKVDGLHDPSAKLRERMSANANAMMNWNICAEMKKLATGDGGQFAKDIYRGCNATLTDGKMTIKLTQNFETARDELAQFVTGDPKATYRTIVKDEDRNKVHMLMAMISQETEKATENGVENALDKRESDLAFTMTGYPYQMKEKQASRTYSIQKLDDGGIALHYVMDKPIMEIDDGNTDGDGYTLGEGSKFTCTLDYTLDGKEFNRLANLGYGKFDDTAGYQVFNRKVNMPDGSRQFRENKLEKVVDTFAEEFKINADCQMDFTMKLEPSDQDLIDAHR